MAWLGAISPALARAPGECEPARGGGAREVVGLHLGDVVAELREGARHVAGEARLDRLLQRRVALAHDLVHDGGLMPPRWSWAKGLPASTASSCFSSPTSTTRGIRSASAIRSRSRACTVEASEPSSTTRAVLANAARISFWPFFRHASFGNPGVAREEALQGLALDPGFGGERARGRGRGREAADRVALLLKERAGAGEHGGLAGAGIALDADGAVSGGKDELHRRLLAVGEGTVTERLVDGAGAHGSRAAGPGRPASARWFPSRRRLRGRW